ncbi:ERAD-associated E3 ubiquitin-protein ligase HRD1 [Novymonas esmeraldas]|uniref:ERAD-associated E3 ubiquitin-protein ligase HRD1 n=1 Tax=Novymonas esmeraldas TaxID=1808958 RepID=A0AAW0ESE1_9TRYP
MVSRKSAAAYVVGSFLVSGLFLADYANTYREFYPAMVALANSSSFRLLLVNTTIALTVALWMVLQFCFFGQLNASEETALFTSFTLYVVECVMVPLYVDQPILSSTSVFFLFTLAWRVLHKLAAERVTTLSTVPVTWLSATRMTAYLCFAIICDVTLLTWTVQTRPQLTGERASVHYSIILIYMLLLSSSLRSTVHFASLFVLRGQHTLLPFVADAVTSIAESLLFVCVYAYIFYKSALPLLLLRGFVTHILRIFEKTSGLAEFLVLARRVRTGMPDATAADLARDVRCTICYEDMVPGSGTKRLPCGHCYHIDCLERWLEGHSTCPYCRANIMQMGDGVAAAPTAPADGQPDGPVEGAVLPLPAVVEEVVAAAAVGAPPPATGAADAPPAAAEEPASTGNADRPPRGPSPVPPATPDDPEAAVRMAYELYLQRLRSSSPPPTRSAAAQPEHGAEASPVGSGSPGRAASPVVRAAAAHTVDELKVRAYRRFHKRLREAERELQAALLLAEEVGVRRLDE